MIALPIKMDEKTSKYQLTTCLNANLQLIHVILTFFPKTNNESYLFWIFWKKAIIFQFNSKIEYASEICGEKLNFFFRKTLLSILLPLYCTYAFHCPTRNVHIYGIEYKRRWLIAANIKWNLNERKKLNLTFNDFTYYLYT